MNIITKQYDCRKKIIINRLNIIRPILNDTLYAINLKITN
jgi:hypothetical protein